MLLVIITLLQYAVAYKVMYNQKDCATCLDQQPNFAVCRPNFGQKSAYCCSASELINERACRFSSLCSHQIPDIQSRSLTCPHEQYPCGIKDPNINLELGTEVTVTVGQYLDQTDRCYYKFSTTDKFMVGSPSFSSSIF